MKINVRSGFVAVVGLANAGKSTVINGLLGERLLISSAKKQTTRRHVRCILSGDSYQLILVDTPGLHQPKNKLGEYMVQEIFTTLENCDVILYIMDATKPSFNLLDEHNGKQPIVLALNKSDLLPTDEVKQMVEKYRAEGRFASVVPISGLLGRNLDQLVDSIKALLPQGDYLYPPDQIMDCDYRFLASELIREQALLLLDEEVPHGIAVEIDSFSEDDAQANISATINVERESHKGIVIGKGGSMLKKIGRGSRLEIQKLMDKKVHLKLWVKVKKNWRKDSQQMKWLGYK